ncbi:MAG: hypothetical protein ABTQ34_04960 [Bdellovibrionales bacterium]
MLEISPVLSGKFDQPSYVPAAVNFTAGETSRSASESESSAEVDTRRYTKFDRTAANAGSTTDFTFDDFLDLINPLEHIPGVSSVFRALNGDSIHPVSRVAGDVLYGSVLGLASAVFGAVGAVADSVSEASNGQDATGLAVSAMLGEDLSASGSSRVARSQTSDVQQLAAAINPSTDASARTLAAMLQPAVQKISPQETSLSSGPQAVAEGQSQSYNLPSQVALQAAASANKAYPLDRSKMPYGGVMAPVNGTFPGQALALSGASGTPQMGSTIYTGRFGAAASDPSAHLRGSNVSVSANNRSDTVASELSGTSSNSQPSGARNPLPQALVDDLVAMRALKQYKSVAAGNRNGFAD